MQLPTARRVVASVGTISAIALLTLATTSTSSSSPEEQTITPQGTSSSAGYRAQIDPATGTFTQDIPPSADAPAVDDVYSTSSEGLISEPSPVRGGGIMQRLNGRFQNAFTATVDADGRFSAECSVVTVDSDEADKE